MFHKHTYFYFRERFIFCDIRQYNRLVNMKSPEYVFYMDFTHIIKHRRYYFAAFFIHEVPISMLNYMCEIHVKDIFGAFHIH